MIEMLRHEWILHLLPVDVGNTIHLFLWPARDRATSLVTEVTYLRTATTEDRLSALAMLSIEPISLPR